MQLQNTFCSLLLFSVLTFLACLQLQANCLEPTLTSIGSVTVIDFDGETTCGEGNDIGVADVCGDGYMGQEDAVYRFGVPVGSDGCYTLSITAAVDAGIFVVEGNDCTAGGNCIGAATGANPSVNVNLNSGANYFIIVSTIAANPCFVYDLDMASCPPQPGEDCVTPYVIAGGLPFNLNGQTTCGFGDDYDSATDPCGSDFINAEDFLFEFTAPTDSSYDISLTNVDTNSGMFVYDGCPEAAGTACVDFGALVGTSNTLTLDLIGGNTYYIAVSNQPFPGCTPFDFELDFTPVIPGSIVIDTTGVNNDPVHLVDNVLVGGCLLVSNITFSGADQSIGSFSSGFEFGIPNGIIISNGDVMEGTGPSTSFSSDNSPGNQTDVDLQALIPGFNVNDAAILEFDFNPVTTTASFSYVFASEEYPNFAPPNGSAFNDVFGFFISGPGIAGPYSNGAENIALIPTTTTPVSINNVNPVTNNAYYDDVANTFAFNGYTVPLIAEITGLTPCETYHIKIAIADGGDSVYDSAVFLEANSFTGGTAPSIQATVPSTGGAFGYEGCEDAYFTIYRDPLDDASSPIDIDFYIDQTAADIADVTVDYDLFAGTNVISMGAGPNYTVTIPAGQDSINVFIVPYEDFTLEPPFETVTIQIDELLCDCTMPAPSTLQIFDAPAVFDAFSTDVWNVCPGENVVMVFLGQGSQFTPYTWSYQDFDALWNPIVANDPDPSGSGSLALWPAFPAVQDAFYIVSFTDGCGRTVVDTTTVTLTPPATPPDATIADPGQVCESDLNTIFTAPSSGGTWTADCGACIDATFGTFDVQAAIAWGPGPYTIGYDINNACGADNDSFMLFLTPSIPVPTITPVPSMCSDVGNIFLTADVAGGTWAGDGIVGGTNMTGEFDPVAALASGPSPYTVFYNVTSPCGGGLTNENIAVNITPDLVQPANINDCDDYDLTLVIPTDNNASGGTLTYYDDDGGGNPNNQLIGAALTVTTDGTYHVIMTNGACSDTTNFTVTLPACCPPAGIKY